MPFPVQCRCGQRFLAQDWLAGKTVACPACGSALLVAAPQAQPALEPLEWSAAQAAPTAGPAAGFPRPVREEEGLTHGLKVAIGAAAGVVGLLLVLIVVQSILSSRRPASPRPQSEPVTAEAGNTQAGNAGSNGRQPASATKTTPPVSPSSLPPRYGPPGSSRSAGYRGFGSDTDSPSQPVSPDDDSSTSTQPSLDSTTGSHRSPPGTGFAPLDRSSAGGSASPTLPIALDRWHSGSASLRGARQVGDEEFVLNHFSWMCELLPFLGHDDLYRQLNFNKSWSDPQNAEVGITVIPEFLNPADSRQTWTGSRLRGLALTHFVGMSGVEDSRNVVAALLPRSDPRAGIFGYGEVARREQITDGTSQTIMLVGSGEIAAPWVQGGGATIRGARQPYFDPLTGFGSRGLAQPGAVVLMADGATRHFSADMDPAVFRALCTIGGGESVDRDQLPPSRGEFPGTR